MSSASSSWDGSSGKSNIFSQRRALRTLEKGHKRKSNSDFCLTARERPAKSQKTSALPSEADTVEGAEDVEEDDDSFSDSDDEMIPKEPGVLKLFVEKCRDIRKNKHLLDLYASDDSMAILKDVSEKANELALPTKSSRKGEEQWSPSLLWNNIHMEIFYIYQVRRLWYSMHSHSICGFINSVIGYVPGICPQARGTNVGDFLRDRKDVLKTFREADEDVLGVLRGVNMGFHSDYEMDVLDMHNLEGLVGSPEFRKWARDSYRFNTYEFCIRLGSTRKNALTKLSKMLMLTALDVIDEHHHKIIVVEDNPIDAIRPAAYLPIFRKLRKKLVDRGIAFIYNRDAKADFVSRARTKGIPMYGSRKRKEGSSRSSYVSRYIEVKDPSDWLVTAIMKKPIFPVKKNTVWIEATIREEVEDLCAPLIRTLSEIDEEGVIIISRHIKNVAMLQAALRAEGIRLIVETSKESQQILEVALKEKGKDVVVLSEKCEWPVEFRGVQVRLLLDTPTRKQEDEGLTVAIPFPSTIARILGIPVEVIKTAEEAEAFLAMVQNDYYFLSPSRWPYRVNDKFKKLKQSNISLPKTTIQKKNLEAQLYQQLISKDNETRVNTEYLQHCMGSNSSDCKDARLAKDIIDTDEDTVLLVFGTCQGMHHPLRKARFPKIFLFKEPLTTDSLLLEEYMSIDQFLWCLLRSRGKKGYTTRVWLVDSMAQTFRSSFPEGTSVYCSTHIGKTARLLHPGDVLYEECRRITMSGLPKLMEEIQPRHPEVYSYDDLGLSESIKKHRDYHDTLDDAAYRLVSLEEHFTVKFPNTFPSDFTMPEAEGIDFLRWILVRVFGSAEKWNEGRVKRAVRICGNMQKDAVAYHTSSVAKRRKLPTVLGVALSTITEGEELIEKLQIKIEATGMTGPWPAESLWLKRGPTRRPRMLFSDFVASYAPDIRMMDHEEVLPGEGFKPRFPRSHQLTGSHIRYLFEEHKNALMSFRGSPTVYAIVQNTPIYVAPPMHS